jgi:hypothetical protein
MKMDEITAWTVKMKLSQMVEGEFKETALSRLLYADYKKPSAYEAIKNRVVFRIKAAVRWATYWAWADHF